MWDVTFVKTGNTCQCMWHLFMHVTPIYTLAPTSWVVQWRWFAGVNALCDLSCKKSQEVTASFQGQFLSSHCFMLCITVEVEPRIAKQYKCQYCCSWKITGERGWRVEQKCLCIIFGGWPEDRKFMEKMHFGASSSMSNKLLLVAGHILTTGLHKCL